MSITVNNAGRHQTLAEFLATGAAAGAGREQEAAAGRFSAALSQALEQNGAGTFQIQATGPDEYIITFGAAGSPKTPAACHAHAEEAQEPDPGGDVPVDLLTGDITAEQLRQAPDAAALLNARAALRRLPSEVKVWDQPGGGYSSLNPSMLATRAEAEAMLERLRELGITPGAIGESHAGGGFYDVDWGGEERRLFDIGGMSVGLLLERYARNPREFADQMTLDEWKGMVSA